MVEAGFSGEDVAFFKNVVPRGVEVGGFMRVEPDTVAKMVSETAGEVGVEQGFARGEDILTADAGADEAGDFVEYVNDGGVGGELVVRGVPINGERAAVVGEVAAIGGAEVEDEEFAGLGAAISRRTSRGGALVVVAGGGGGLAEGIDGGGLQFVEDGEFGDAGSDEVFGAGVHGIGGGDGVADEGKFVGILAAAEAMEIGFDVLQLRKLGQAEGVEEAWGGATGFESEAVGFETRGFQGGGDGLFLVLTQGAEPLGFEGDDVAGGVVIRSLIGGDEEAAVVGEQDGGCMKGVRAKGGEVLDVLRPGEERGGKVVVIQDSAQSSLA